MHQAVANLENDVGLNILTLSVKVSRRGLPYCDRYQGCGVQAPGVSVQPSACR